MRLRTKADGLIVEDRARERWVDLRRALDSTGSDDGRLRFAAADALAFLRGGDPIRLATAELLEAVGADESVATDPAPAGIPFRPRSLRAFMLWDSHLVQSSRVLVERFFPRPRRGSSRATSG